MVNNPLLKFVLLILPFTSTIALVMRLLHVDLNTSVLFVMFITSIAGMIIYCALLFKSQKIVNNEKIGWLLALLFAHTIAAPIFWFKHIK